MNLTVSKKRGRKLSRMSSSVTPPSLRDPYGGPSPLVSTPNFILSPFSLGVEMRMKAGFRNASSSTSELTGPVKKVFPRLRVSPEEITQPRKNLFGGPCTFRGGKHRKSREVCLSKTISPRSSARFGFKMHHEHTRAGVYGSAIFDKDTDCPDRLGINICIYCVFLACWGGTRHRHRIDRSGEFCIYHLIAFSLCRRE